MRRVLPLLLALLAATPPAARAEFPASLRIHLGMGLGAGHSAGQETSGPFGVFGSDFAWRKRPGQAAVLSLEASAGPIGVMYPMDARDRLGTIDQQAVMLGREWSRADSGVMPYFQAGLGIGRIGTPRPTLGPALGTTAALRIAPDPGPIGLVLGFHTTYVFAARARCHVACLFFGFNVHPR